MQNDTWNQFGVVCERIVRNIFQDGTARPEARPLPGPNLSSMGSVPGGQTMFIEQHGVLESAAATHNQLASADMRVPLHIVGSSMNQYVDGLVQYSPWVIGIVAVGTVALALGSRGWNARQERRTAVESLAVLTIAAEQAIQQLETDPRRESAHQQRSSIAIKGLLLRMKKIGRDPRKDYASRHAVMSSAQQRMLTS